MCFPQQKRRGDHTRYSLHSSRVVGSYPLQSKRATSRPHADMKTIRLITRKHFTYGVPQAKTYNKGMRSIIPMSIYPLLSSLTVILVKFPTLSKSQRTKRVINAFSIYGYPQCDFPPQREIFSQRAQIARCHLLHIIGVKMSAKIRKIPVNRKFSLKNFDYLPIF